MNIPHDWLVITFTDGFAIFTLLAIAFLIASAASDVWNRFTTDKDVPSYEKILEDVQYWKDMSNRYTDQAEFYSLECVRLQKELKEHCICAAVKDVHGNIMRGQRHSDCIQAILNRKSKPRKTSGSQGFITSTGRYINRVEGKKLQKEAGIASVDYDGYRGNKLYSEDLY